MHDLNKPIEQLSVVYSLIRLGCLCIYQFTRQPQETLMRLCVAKLMVSFCFALYCNWHYPPVHVLDTKSKVGECKSHEIVSLHTPEVEQAIVTLVD